MDPKELIAEVHKTWTEMKSTLALADADRKKHGEVLGETNAKLDAMNARLDELEAKFRRPATGDGGAEKKSKADPERKAAFREYCRKGEAAMAPEQQKMLTVADNTTGGYFADDDLESGIVKNVIEVSPMRALAKVRTTSNRSVKVRKRTGTFKARWAVEGDQKSETKGLKYGMDEIPNEELYADVLISLADLEDSSFDLEGELSSEFGDQFGLAEADGFVNGDGNGKPEGFLTLATIEAVNNGHATQLQYDGIIDFIHALKSTYARNGKIVLNRKTLGAVRKIKNSTGDPLWVPLSAGAPATIAGVGYEEFPDMPDIASGKKPMAYGDWKRGYIVVDRLQTSVLRDPYSNARIGAVEFIARKRVGGQVLMAEAIKTLKMA